MSQPPSRDVLDLAGFGYQQRLRRSLGSFSAFAIGFSYLSILTGLPQLFYLGFAAGGPAFFWTWPVVLAGQFLVALCFAELSARYPLSGGVYQWSRRVGPPGLGWMAGWIYLCCSIITMASVALALGPTLMPLSARLRPLADVGPARNAVLIGCVLIAFSTLINAVGVRLLARINNTGAVAELCGAVALIALLWAAARRGPGIVFETQGRGDGRVLGYLGPFLAAGLTATFVMYGFDTAGSLAEETRDPRRRAPRAILAALGTVGVVGALLILGALMAVGDVRDPNLGRIDGGMPMIVRGVLGGPVGTALLATIAAAIAVCTLTVQAAAVRLMFAMARDNNLPYAEALAALPEASRTPVVPAVVLGAAAVAVLILNLDFPRVVEAMASVSIVWANLAYLLVTAPQLCRRSRDGKAHDRDGGGFSLGRWGVPVNVLAVAWGVLVVANTAWPRVEIYGEPWYRLYIAPIATLAMVGVGGLYYGLIRRSRTGVLEAHRAPAPAIPAEVGAGL